MRIEKISTGILLLFIASFPSCTEDEGVDYPDLKIFLDRFENAASDLGYDFDLSTVQAVYVDEVRVNNTPYCGYGYWNYNGTGQGRIEISMSGACGWAQRSDIEKENLFFHEIGHAFFSRSHDETTQCDGSPLSLMISTANTWTIYGDSDEEKRQYYISELIDPLAALDKCIDYGRDFAVDSVIYTMTSNDSQWIFDSVNGNYSGEQGSGADVLSIATTALSNTDKNGYWFRQFPSPAIPECAEVKLKVRMNSSMLTGAGAAISVRAYQSTPGNQGASIEQLFRLSTEDTPASGQLIDHTEELTIPCYTRRINYLVIFVVMLGGTQGEVDFDEIQIVVKE